MRNVSLISCLIELSSTILTFCTIIKLFLLLLIYYSLIIIFISFSCFHCLSKHLTLCFPLRYFIFTIYRLLLLSSWLLLLYICISFILWWFITKVIFSRFILNLSVLLRIKDFSLLYKNLLTNFHMFLQSFLIEFPLTRWTLYPILVIHIFFFLILCWFLIIFLTCVSISIVNLLILSVA